MASWDDAKMEERDWNFFIRGMKAFWSLLEDRKKAVRVILIWITIIVILQLALPYFLKLIFDELEIMRKTKEVSPYFVKIIMLTIAFMVITLILDRFMVEKKFLRIIIGFENWLPASAQKKLLNLSLSYHERENTGETVAKIYKGCSKLVDIMSQIRWGIYSKLVYMVINSVIILVMEWRLGLIFVLPFIPALALYWKGWKRSAPYWEKWEEMHEYSSRQFDGSIRNIGTVQNFAQEKREFQSFWNVRQEMEQVDLTACLPIQNYYFVSGLLLNISFYIAIIIGAIFVMWETCTFGTVFYIAFTGNATSQNMWQLINEYNQISRKLIAVLRMKELLDEEPEIMNKSGSIIPQSYMGKFQFKKVVFHYPNKDQAVLNGIDLVFLPNQMIALVGKSGEGKTTVFRLLTRMYESKGGSIFLDDRDISELDLYWYRRLFAIVQQDVDIFDANILDNIRYSNPNAPIAQVEEAVRASYLEYVLTDANRFPQGLMTEVGERGVRLSGGEKQRVGIARAYLALLNGAKVLVLDEATSSLDSQAERAIQEMIDDLRKRKNISIIAIAHRLSTISRSDMIYVIGNGQIIEKGDHDKLQKKNGLYAELVKYQQLGELRE